MFTCLLHDLKGNNLISFVLFTNLNSINLINLITKISSYTTKNLSTWELIKTILINLILILFNRESISREMQVLIFFFFIPNTLNGLIN